MKNLLPPLANGRRSKVTPFGVSVPEDLQKWAKREARRLQFRSTSAFVTAILERAREQQDAAAQVAA